MDTKQRTREQISALADGELQGVQVDQAFSALRDCDTRGDWELYHRIGDAMRSEEVADVHLSSDFAARLAARLQAEPAHIVPVTPTNVGATARTRKRRWTLPGLAAAAAMASIAYVATPQLMVALNGPSSSSAQEPTFAEVKSESAVVPVAAIAAAGSAMEPGSGVVLRDPRIDDYLLAHQRFSPSVFSSAQYARSATLAAQPDK